MVTTSLLKQSLRIESSSFATAGNSGFTTPRPKLTIKHLVICCKEITDLTVIMALIIRVYLVSAIYLFIYSVSQIFQYKAREIEVNLTCKNSYTKHCGEGGKG